MQADSCPFCHLAAADIVATNAFHVVIRDRYPVSLGHSLLIPKRHVASLFELTTEEFTALYELLQLTRDQLTQAYAPDGFNIGVNVGAAAGQTVFHLHMHVIPRYHGDSPDPRGGVRWVMPDKAAYWQEP